MTWQDDAVAMREAKHTYPEIARAMLDKYGVVLSDEQIRSVYRRRRDGEQVRKQRIIFEDIKVPADDAIETYVAQVLALQEAEQALDTKQVDGTVTIEDDRPIGIAQWADWHWGGWGVDYQLFQSDYELIKATDGLYAVFLGDSKENYISGAPPGSQFGQIIQPGKQDAVVLHYVGGLRDKWLAFLEGCHDKWTDNQANVSFIAKCAEVGGALNFWHGGTLTVKLGSQEYKGHLRHKFFGESKLNPLLPCRRMMEHYGYVDFAVVAHKHFPAKQEIVMAGQRCYLIRPGSYKVWDDWGQQIGGYAGIPAVPVLILWPHEHRLEAYMDLRAGVEALRYARGA